MRSILALAAALWFGYNAMTFLPQGVYLNSGSPTGIDGDPGALAITWAARVLCVGLALLALSLVEWGKIVAYLRSPGNSR
ncbi:MAG: hypothetical protein QOJ81_1232 [Chloroflexota bacterium]|nr:hypothetical protein [Chloroflexota bacterium]